MKQPSQLQHGLDILFRSRTLTDKEIENLSPEYFKIIDVDLYRKIKDLKSAQERSAKLQIENVAFREAWAVQMFDTIARKLFRRGKKRDEIAELNAEIATKQAELSKEMESREMGDSFFLQYIPSGDYFIRVTDEAKHELMTYFYSDESLSISTERIAEVVARFKTIYQLLREKGYSDDIRVASYAAMLARGYKEGSPAEKDIDGFLSWDTRLTHFIYGQNANPIIPLTYDRFPINAILYNITGVDVEDRFIAYRIAYELFAPQYRTYFRHQLRTLIAAARLVSGMKYWTRNQTEFETEFQEQMKRFRWYLLKYVRQSETTDLRFGRGVSVSAGGSDNFAVFSDTPAANVNLAGDAGIGVPDNAMIYASRIINLHAEISAIHPRVAEYLRALEKLNNPFCVATILSDTNLYYKERKDQQQSAFSDDLNSFVRASVARFEHASQLKPRHFSLTPVHAALLSLMPGVIFAKQSRKSGCDGENIEYSQSTALSLIDELAESLRNSGFQGNQLRLLTFLLADHCCPYIRAQDFFYELWEAERLI